VKGRGAATLTGFLFLFDGSFYSILVGSFLKIEETFCKIKTLNFFDEMLCIQARPAYYCRALAVPVALVAVSTAILNRVA
jgi:hypothetical protein